MMHLKPLILPPRDTSVLMLLVAVNLLLLSLFALLNSTVPQPENASPTRAVSALDKSRLGAVQYNQGQASPARFHDQPRMAWADVMRGSIQGVVVNQLALQNTTLVADAERVTLTLPEERIFQQDELMVPELIKALQYAAQDALVTWRVYGISPRVVAQGSALAAVTGYVQMLYGTPRVEMIITPRRNTLSVVGTAVQQVGERVNATTQGVSNRAP